MLHVHRAERADALVVALGALLAQPLHDPFAAEVVAVPTRGMERWLAQRLSGGLGASPGRRDGVCANVLFPSPGRLVRDAVAAASGIAPEEDPWLPERAAWPLLEVVDAGLAEPWLAALAAHLGDDADAIRRARRLGVVRHLARRFDAYALHRPDLLAAWADGADGGWQAELWRRLRDRIALPGPAERRAGACARLQDDPAAVELPARIALFGLTRLPAGHLHVLRALAAGREVHLLLLHPSPALWDAVAAAPDRHPRALRRAGDATAALARNRLLASWGRDARETQLVLAAGGGHADDHHPAEQREHTLLARLQADVRANRAPAGEHDLDPADRSLEIHACHGRARQVEVLRDAILHLLADDPALEPRDVIVMCPDIEAFAPLIGAAFGGAQVDDDGPVAALRVRLADRALRQTNPVLGVVARLLELADGRLTASQVLDLADREPVRRRFGLDDDDIARLRDWTAESGIRWGLDAAHRAPFHLGDLPNGTWAAGLDRILLGVAMTEDDLHRFGGVLPLDDVESGAIDLAGRFAELMARLRAAIAALGRAQPIADWAAAIATAADALTAAGERDAWQRAQLDRLLDEVVAEAAGAGPALALPEVRALLAERLEGRPTRASFRTGHLTVCTLMPMRSVPHRAVCLLGLDDGSFPRKAPRDGDDLMLADPRIGERDPRTEDRQLLLDALLAATDRLVITYTGNDERTNTAQPPAVPIGELLDVVDATVAAGGPPARDRVVVHHPLQPFDPRNFAPERPWSFDPVALAGARSLCAPRAAPPPFLAGPLPPADAATLELDDLVRFVEHPVRAFLRRRLRLYLGEVADDVDDALPVELDGLERWGVGQRLLKAFLAGADHREAALAEIARGALPPGSLGLPVVQEIMPVAERIAAEALALSDAAPAAVDVRVELPDGRVLGGTVSGVSGTLVRAAHYARLAPKHRLATWVRLLAPTAAAPEQGWQGATIGRAPSRGGVAVARLPALSAGIARTTLAALADLYARGMREPLPLYAKTSAAWAEAAARGDDPVAAAEARWSADRFAAEAEEPEHELVLGGRRTLQELLAEPPRDDERWAATEATRLGGHARRLWDELLAVEELRQE